ncbi:4Fe-4S dicluster domain-containing protein [Microtetraspora sp. NBRC 16547]|uniref:4Fe-4S dicluster domain-containing protein n=1 Tax=Microtetraspora sp. NBRC 16547 TaxID=3030993 RepID=UPI0024A5C860|nr:4Fe-4S dicluster domain-containing protein [Microtetraspora sp. NBRC 16547]GLW98547.1 4Fe-4S ferredoxin [Microtetraspora sp. NBRC 16547]
MAERMGFFTDTSICIGCKACEVACKEWNQLPDDGFVFEATSYDNTAALGASTWRHVAFIEQQPVWMPDGDPMSHGGPVPHSGPMSHGGPMPDGGSMPHGGESVFEVGRDGRWLMSSDVCKHCTNAGCLDVCPTGAIFRTEFGTVVVQPDICNGCGYCVPACPFGVIDRREGDGRAWKCTMCYDRLRGGLEPACAKACPTDSIQFGPLDELRERAAARVDTLHAAGHTEARLYGESPGDGVGGMGAFFLLLDEPEVYGLPPDPVVPTRDLPAMWGWAGAAIATMAAAVAASFLGGRSR